ncbi:MAG: hypothetical protein U0271_09145 [Polyangiaceae bacterium]
MFRSIFYPRIGFLFSALTVFASTACGDDSSGVGGGGSPAAGGFGGVGGAGGSSGSAGGESLGGAGGGSSCTRDPGPADKARFVVVGHPYDGEGSYEVLSLASDGELTTTGTHFTMGPPADRPIRFTPDGAIGFAIQDDGSIGVFRLDQSGAVTVVVPRLVGDFYAESVALDPTSSTLWILDPNWPESGGGLYPSLLSCDGVLTPGALALPAKNGVDVFFAPNGDLLFASRSLDAMNVEHLQRAQSSAPFTVVASADAFGDDEAITSYMALTRGKKHVILADNHDYSPPAQRVAAIPVTADGLGAAQTLEDVVYDPYSIAVSPFDNAVIVTSGFGDGIFVFDYEPTSSAPLTLRGELPYAGAPPQLPGALTSVERGPLDGRTLIADVRGVYSVQFKQDGTVDDLGVFDLGGGNENIVSGIGVQP